MSGAIAGKKPNVVARPAASFDPLSTMMSRPMIASDARAGEAERSGIVDQVRVVLGHSHRDRALTGQRLAGRDVEVAAADLDRATKGVC